VQDNAAEEAANEDTGRVPRIERRNRTATHRAAVEGVAAYLADEDVDVYNITDAAIREDPVAAALNLTALAAAAVTALANVTGRTPYEALRSIDEAGFGEVSRQPRPAR
jgi:Pyruvate/2-oxoacid:ferredoxin oxidoreductase gamma subunit